MSLDFLNPSIAWLLPLAAIPILLYIFNRQRHKRVDWAAMAFLERALKKNRRRLKLENLLLLAVRVTVILLVCAALARPAVTGGGLTKALADRRKQVVLVLDASLSMRYSDGVKTSFERAKEAAGRVVRDHLKRDDQVGLIVLGATGPRAVLESPRLVDDDDAGRGLKAAILTDIRELEPGYGPADAVKALEAVIRYLPGFDKDEADLVDRRAAAGEKPLPVAVKEVFFVTDLQRSGFVDDRGVRGPALDRLGRDLAARKAELTILDVGAAEPANAAVTAIEAPYAVVGVDIPIKLKATVKSYSATPLKDVAVALYVDDVLHETKPRPLEPGEEADVELYAVAHKPGPLKVTVELKTDGLAADNRRHLVLEAKDSVPVLIVDGRPGQDFGDGETDFLAIAIAPSDDSRVKRQNLLAPTVVTDAHLPEEVQKGLGRYAVIILANVLQVSEDQAEKLEAYAREGGAVLFFLGGQVDSTLYNEKLWRGGKGLFPGRILAERQAGGPDRFFRLTADDFRHPVLREFEPAGKRPFFYKPTFQAYLELELPEPAPAPAPPAGAGGGAAPARAGDVVVIARFERRQLGDGTERAAGEDAGGAGAGGAGEGEGEGEGEAAPEGEGAAGDAPAGGNPGAALVERRFGRGRVAVFTSTAGYEWNDFFATKAYQPFCERLVSYLAEAALAKRNLTVGETIELLLPAAEFTTEVLLTAPAKDERASGDRIRKTLDPVASEGGVDRVRLHHAETWRPGMYEVRFGPEDGSGGEGPGRPPAPLGGGSGADGAPPAEAAGGGAAPGAPVGPDVARLEVFAVNVESGDESNLERLDPARLKDLAPGLKADVIREGGSAGGDKVGSDRPAELWRYLLFVLLGLLAAETAIACYFGRKAT